MHIAIEEIRLLVAPSIVHVNWGSAENGLWLDLLGVSFRLNVVKYLHFSKYFYKN